jgi:hypothetical protein
MGFLLGGEAVGVQVWLASRESILAHMALRHLDCFIAYKKDVGSVLREMEEVKAR